MFRDVVKIHPITTGQTFGADEDLLRQVTDGKHVTYTSREDSDVIIVFCPISSRVGSDVEAALRPVSDDKKIILVLMHHTRDVDYSTGGRRWSETFKNVVLDVDVLFHQSVPGLLHCPQNTAAVNQIQDAVTQSNSSVRSSDRLLSVRKIERLLSVWIFDRLLNVRSSGLLCIYAFLETAVTSLYQFIRTWGPQRLAVFFSDSSTKDTVKVHTVITGQTFGADEELLRQLQSELTYTSQEDSDVIIVFCPISSRVGSDVEAAMRDVSASTGNKRVVLVLMHHTRDVSYSTVGKKWSESFPSVILEVHVLFHESVLGLLTCDTNREAVHKLNHFVAQYYQPCRYGNDDASHQKRGGCLWMTIVTVLKVCKWLMKWLMRLTCGILNFLHLQYLNLMRRVYSQRNLVD